MYSRDLIDDLLKATDIVTVISAYIPVIKKGRSYVAICPFHDDKNPSLNISRDKQIFKCFVCNVGGNAITFVQRHLNISYQEAVKKVAELVGFHDPRLESEAYKPKIDAVKQPLFDTINDLQSLYQYGLNIPEGKIASDYLAKRHIDQDQIKKYGIGYALAEGEKTIEYLEKKGHSLDKIKDIGIMSSHANSDANAGRLIFPLRDPNGQVIGFSARKLNPNDHDSPKYVNSPDTKIFKKSLNLYNYHNAKNSARRDGYIYVLEGFMDVMALDKVGIPSAVAVMGTSLSKEQIELLRRLNAEVRLCLDGDNPGQKGMMRIILQLNKANIPFRLVMNPNDLRDPDDILQESGPEALREAMNHLVDSFEFQMNYYQNVEKISKVEDRRKVMDYFVPLLRTVKDDLERENDIVKLSKVTGYEVETIRSQIGKIENSDEILEETTYSAGRSHSSYGSEDKRFQRLKSAERQTLFYMLQNIEAVQFFRENIDHFCTKIYNDIASYVVEYTNRKKETVFLPSLIADFEAQDDPNKEEMSATVSNLAEASLPPYSREVLLDCLKAISEEMQKISEQEQTKQALRGKTPEEQGALLKDLANKRRAEKWGNKHK